MLNLHAWGYTGAINIVTWRLDMINKTKSLQVSNKNIHFRADFHCAVKKFKITPQWILYLGVTGLEVQLLTIGFRQDLSWK